MKNQSNDNDNDQKDNEKSPESRLEQMELCDINDRDFNTAVLKTLN